LAIYGDKEKDDEGKSVDEALTALRERELRLEEAGVTQFSQWSCEAQAEEELLRIMKEPNATLPSS